VLIRKSTQFEGEDGQRWHGPIINRLGPPTPTRMGRTG